MTTLVYFSFLSHLNSMPSLPCTFKYDRVEIKSVSLLRGVGFGSSIYPFRSFNIHFSFHLFFIHEFYSNYHSKSEFLNKGGNFISFKNLLKIY